MTNQLRRTVAIAVTLAVSSTIVFAQESHRRVAQALHEAIVAADSSTTIQLVAAAMGTQDPLLRKHKSIVESWLGEQIASPAYAEVKIATYMEVYSEEELTQIVEMARTPAFRVFQAKHQQTLRLSAPKLAQLARDNQPELERRIQQAERGSK